MKQVTKRSYSVDDNGIIFTSDTTIVTDDNGMEIARGEPLRVPYTPGGDLGGTADSKLTAIAQAIWTPDIVAEYAAQVAANKGAFAARSKG